MTENILDPTILEFRAFLNKNPKLIKEIRNGGESIQNYYEKWVLLGESDPYWDKYKQVEKKKTDKKNNQSTFNLVEKLKKWGEEADMDQIQERVKQWDQTISLVQGMLNQYQEGKQEKVPSRGYYDNKYRD
ncbi:spore coat protein YlbD [Virgibacillus sp. DJP39]|uniref:spore coat protein YlbD n=1 Tax=Virgibacillus sp. DJP39 TaxID=3409790 RepID=UPI003BB77892